MKKRRFAFREWIFQGSICQSIVFYKIIMYYASSAARYVNQYEITNMFGSQKISKDVNTDSCQFQVDCCCFIDIVNIYTTKTRFQQ